MKDTTTQAVSASQPKIRVKKVYFTFTPLTTTQVPEPDSPNDPGSPDHPVIIIPSARPFIFAESTSCRFTD